VSRAPNTRGRWHPEEWQATMHETAYPLIEKRPFVWASFIWNMFDFASDWRTEGDRNGINDKGLVTHDRKVKKDAFFYYKSAWRNEPVVYITSRRHAKREQALTQVKVYSNCDKVELKVNGKKRGALLPRNRTCVWEGIILQPGVNRIEVSARKGKNKVFDRCEWTYAGSPSGR
ncbi:MAG TPA: DUF4982 domain-containing protein, partial [bacterium]